jgi:hypothetical protein
MKPDLSLSARWARYVAGYSGWVRATYLISLPLSLAFFAMYYFDGGVSLRVLLWPAIFFFFLGILNFERAGFSTLLQSKDAEIAELRGKIETPA